MKRANHRQRYGMTAIEVLAATVLASLMLASVLGVMGGLSRNEKALRSRPIAPDWHRRLAEQLLWDVRNSREVSASRDRLRLVGFAGRDFVTGHATGRPTAIEYYFVERAGDRWLVRREAHLDARNNDSWRAELVVRGAARLEFGANKIDQVAIGSMSPSRNTAAIPERIAVRLYTQASRGPVFDQLLVVR